MFPFQKWSKFLFLRNYQHLWAISTSNLNRFKKKLNWVWNRKRIAYNMRLCTTLSGGLGRWGMGMGGSGLGRGKRGVGGRGVGG